jgi:uncharacterized protein YegP (UPF0339 family)
MTFEVLNHKGTQRYYWRIKASNGAVLASSEGYANFADAYYACQLVKVHAATAPIVNLAHAA